MGQLDGIKDYRFGQNIKRTPEEERELKRKGAAASHVARRRNKTMQQCAKLLLSAEPDDNAKKLLAKNGIEEDDMTNQMVIMYNLMQLAKDGDVKAVKALAEIVGEGAAGQALKQRKLEAKQKKVYQDKTLELMERKVENSEF